MTTGAAAGNRPPAGVPGAPRPGRVQGGALARSGARSARLVFKQGLRPRAGCRARAASTRQTVIGGGTLNAGRYDPWGAPIDNQIAPFGFAGELQGDGGLVYLRARWYTPQQGAFTSRDPFAGWAERPYSQHYFQYGYSNPVLVTDPSGRCLLPDGTPCPQPGAEAVRCGQPGQPACGATTAPSPTPRVPNKNGQTLLLAGGVAITKPNPFAIAIGLCLFAVGGLVSVAVQSPPRYITAIELVPAPEPQPQPKPDPRPTFPPILPPNALPTATPNTMSVFLPGGDIPQTTQHIIDAIGAGKPSIVTYRGPNNGYGRTWLSKMPACKGSSMTQWCDEYPFNSVDEGGPGNNPSLRLVPGAEQRKQGGSWSGFLSSCKVATGEKVKIEPNLTLTTTTWTCK